MKFLPPANCSDPTPPIDGSIEPYQNTAEGTVIFFMCNPMFVPTERMTATCGCNGMWTPEPASLTCTCEYLPYCCLLLSSCSFFIEKSRNKALH